MTFDFYDLTGGIFFYVAIYDILIQLLMSKASKFLKIGSLNFSGINTNPFEYDDGSDVIAGLNNKFKLIVAQEDKNLKEWPGAKLDKEYKKDRLTICFGDEIELVDGKLPNKQQFQLLWWQRYNCAKKNIKYVAKPDEEKDVLKMDYIFYRAAVMYIYSIDQCNQLNDKIKGLDPLKLLEFLNKSKSKNACSLVKKKEIAINYLKKQNLDLFCLQQAGSVNWADSLFDDYVLQETRDSKIIYKKSMFGNVDVELTQKYKEKLYFNKDTVSIFTENGFLLISAHLKSNKEHLEQAKDVQFQLKQVLDQEKDIKIIMGIDANHFLNCFKIPYVQITPHVNTKPTTTKKRTFIQAQYKKAGLPVDEVKDHIITNLPLSVASIELADSEPAKGQLLPNDRNPYDHFIVRAYVGLY